VVWGRVRASVERWVRERSWGCGRGTLGDSVGVKVGRYVRVRVRGCGS
jgi:hypothetical protein